MYMSHVLLNHLSLIHKKYVLDLCQRQCTTYFLFSHGQTSQQGTLESFKHSAKQSGRPLPCMCKHYRCLYYSKDATTALLQFCVTYPEGLQVLHSCGVAYDNMTNSFNLPRCQCRSVSFIDVSLCVCHIGGICATLLPIVGEECIAIFLPSGFSGNAEAS